MIETDRLILRAWRDEDLDSMAAQNADPRVMQYFPSTRTRQQTADMMAAMNQSLDEHGFGFIACERKSDHAMIGLTGMAWLNFEADFGPVVEIGWRLGGAYWGQGYASEAALRWLDYGFQDRGLARIIAIAVVANRRSIGVMERIGMSRVVNGDFDHPLLPDGHALARHVRYEARAQ